MKVLKILFLIFMVWVFYFSYSQGGYSNKQSGVQNITMQKKTTVVSDQVTIFNDAAKQQAWITKGKNAVLEKLKDAESAEFRDVRFSVGADKIPMTCGKINAKNSLGGYVGYQRFISAGSVDHTYLESEIDGFDDLWGRLCQNM